MRIVNSAPSDLDQILYIYEQGIKFQKSVFHRYWPPFDKEFLVKEILSNLHWKIMIGNNIAGVFSALLEDPLVWGEVDLQDSIYLHRIVCHSDFRGNSLMKEIVNWALQYGKDRGRKFIRLDTFLDNVRLSEYYKRCGFRLYGMKYFLTDKQIPEHYKDGLSLFEMSII